MYRFAFSSPADLCIIDTAGIDEWPLRIHGPQSIEAGAAESIAKTIGHNQHLSPQHTRPLETDKQVDNHHRSADAALGVAQDKLDRSAGGRMPSSMPLRRAWLCEIAAGRLSSAGREGAPI